MKTNLHFEITEAEHEYLIEIGDNLIKRHFLDQEKTWYINKIVTHPGIIEVTYKIPTNSLKVNAGEIAKISFTTLSNIDVQSGFGFSLITFRIQRSNVNR